MSAKAVASKGALLLGQVFPSAKQNASKIRIKSLDFDSNLHMYFSKFDYLYAHDPNKIGKVGDLVLVQQLPQKMTTLISHKVLKVVYPLGDTTDPITGKKCISMNYRDEEEHYASMYGPADTKFKYEEAPPRGWQEDKKDFTHQESYAKYHDDGKDQKYAL